MPRSFLVQKARYVASHPTDEDSAHRVINASPQKLVHNRLDPPAVSQLEDGEKPIDYSLKNMLAQLDTRGYNAEHNREKDNKDNQAAEIKSTIADGRIKSRKTRTYSVSENPKYTCQECGKYYATSSNLSRHKQTHRSMESTQAKKCPHCEKVYVSMPALSMHVLTHKLKHTCRTCGKAFSRPWLLQGHMRSHTGERPYSCPYCQKKFADRSNLRAHTQTHTDDKDFKCKLCGKSFAVKSYLTKHMESACSASDQRLTANLAIMT